MVDAGACGSGGALAGLRVLVTRPWRQSAGLAALIEKCGGTAIRFPVIEILPVHEPRAKRLMLASLDDFDLVIFVSPNAVEHGLALMDTARARRSHARLMAVGESTAAALAQAGFACVLRPAGSASSEALLALPALQGDAVAASRILIVRGEGGRPLLGDTLSKRGARVQYAEVYRRARPALDGGALADRGRNGGIDTIVITSLQGLENLFALLGKDATEWLRMAGYVVVSERLAAHAQALGIVDQSVVAAGADDEALIEALIRWRGLHPDIGR
jgi:uroporphyrinogen-III synthase